MENSATDRLRDPYCVTQVIRCERRVVRQLSEVDRLCYLVKESEHVILILSETAKLESLEWGTAKALLSARLRSARAAITRLRIMNSKLFDAIEQLTPEYEHHRQRAVELYLDTGDKITKLRNGGY